ncbi:unnamed protein product [Trichobilharzia regenti]|nr:unnamed protein product [Trichobilharzia regenti]
MPCKFQNVNQNYALSCTAAADFITFKDLEASTNSEYPSSFSHGTEQSTTVATVEENLLTGSENKITPENATEG